jgi:hypothetical protein
MEGFILSRRPLLYVMFNDIIFEPTITINIKLFFFVIHICIKCEAFLNLYKILTLKS